MAKNNPRYQKDTDTELLPSAQELNRIEQNWMVLTKLVNSLENSDAKEALTSLCAEVKNRMAVTPASTRTDYTGCFPGGLVAHSLNVAKVMSDLNKTLEVNVSRDSIIITGLFHDIGKIGNEKHDYYKEQTSNWHRERGMYYEINSDFNAVPVCQRSLWWLNGSGCPLTEDELAAISSLASVGQNAFNFQFYNASWLTVLLQTAVRVSCLKGTGKRSILDV